MDWLEACELEACPDAAASHLKAVGATAHESGMSGSVGALATAAYLRAARVRGKTVPKTCHQALVWAESVFKVDLRASSDEMASLVTYVSTVGASVACKARLIPIQYVVEFEMLVLSPPTLPIGIFAGVCVPLAHTA